MNLKKAIISFIVVTAITLMVCLAIIPNVVESAELSTPLYFGIAEIRTTTDMGYAMGDSDSESQIIWKIVKYSGENTNDPTEVSAYCIDVNTGAFINAGDKDTYDISYNMKTEQEAMANQNQVLYDLVNGGQYDNLLALADLLYVPGVSTESEREALLEASGANAVVNQELGEEYYLTDDEIEAVQQAAIWYFTNGDEDNGKYDVYGKEAWAWYTTSTSSGDYTNFSSYNPTNEALLAEHVGYFRQQEMAKLYDYLIDTAKSNADSGINDENTILTVYVSSEDALAQPIMVIEKVPGEFDLALRKYITAINGETLTDTRVPVIDESSLETGTTAEYNHRKDPVEVENGDVVTYNITIYNEGDIDGRATTIIDQLPTGLKFSQLITEGFTAEYDEDTNRVTITRDESNTDNLSAYESGNLDSETIVIECVVDSSVDGQVLTNVAWIAEEVDENGTVITTQTGEDRDSEPGTTPDVNKDNMEDYTGNTDNKDDLTDSNYFYEGEQDDDDFEKLIVSVPEEEEFDLKLIKRITAVNGEEVSERLLGVDVSNLADGTATTATTADYEMNKEPVAVSTGDLVTYTFRIYNEGDIDGYVEEITEEIPEGLEFLGATIDGDMNEITDEDELAAVEFNTYYGWTYVDGDTTKISTDYLGMGKGEEITTPGANLIKAFDPDSPYSDTETEKNPDYKEISVILKVVAEDPDIGIIRNEAAITEDADSEGNPVDDRDSSTDDWVKYEDDEDYDNIILQEFDLALRKFITAVDDEEVTDRVPEVSYDRDTDEITYTHTKDPVEVITGNIVEYTIRVYNEGDIAGYAQEIADDIPDGLQFLPDNETNIEYRWVMYDADGNVTDNVEDAVEVRTDYLSKEQETTEGENLLQAFDPDEEIGEGNPDYRDVKIVFEVVEPTTSDRVLINSAQITEDADENGNPVDDIDSIPDEWNEGEDDQDREYVELVYFDLSLKKWVTEAIVIEDGVETITQTGHTADTDPEPVVKVELYRKDINDVTVKFRYTIRVTNEGDIAGYAKEITDYVPDGLTFIAEDNPGWTDEGNGVISTRLLEDVLLQPGEYAEVEVVLTWINGEDNMGTMTNIAEISEDYNDKGAPDIDSTPDNQVWGEDDIDDASVLLSVETGRTKIYMALGLTVLGTLAGGVTLIKKYVI